MKKNLLALSAAVLFSTSAFADTYQLTFGWTDPTTYQPGEVPVYSAKYRVAGGAETVLPPLATPGGSTVVTATPGDAIDVAARACNQTLCSAWTQWVTATAQHPPTTPATQTGLSITIIRQ